MAMTFPCPKCGAKNSIEAVMCRRCGASFYEGGREPQIAANKHSRPSTTRPQCANCGYRRGPNDRSCSKCGWPAHGLQGKQGAAGRRTLGAILMWLSVAWACTGSLVCFIVFELVVTGGGGQDHSAPELQDVLVWGLGILWPLGGFACGLYLRRTP